MSRLKRRPIFILGLLVTLAYVFLSQLSLFEELGVPTMSPTFADLRLITSASECLQNSKWSIDSTSCDPWNRPFNYPSLWVYLFAFLNITETQTDFIGVLEIIILGISFIYWLWRLSISGKREITHLSLIAFIVFAFSPPILLLVERGNVDILIFAGLSIAAELVRRKRLLTSGFVISILAILKLFPFPAILVPLMRFSSWNKRVILIAVSFLGVALIFDDLKYISERSLTTWNAISFGNNLIPLIFLHKLQLPSSRGLVALISILLFSIVTLMFWLFFKARIATLSRAIETDGELSPVFCLFGLAFVTSYLVGTSYDYRLILSLPIFMILLNVLPSATQKFTIFLFLLLTMYGGHLLAEVHSIGIILNIFCDAVIMIFVSLQFLILAQILSKQMMRLH